MVTQRSRSHGLDSLLVWFLHPTLLSSGTFQCIRLFYLSRNPVTLEMKKESTEKLKT